MTGVVSASDKKNTSLVEVFFANFKKTLPWWKSFLLISKNTSLVEVFFVHNKKHVRGGNVLLTKCKKDFPGGSVF